jgi:hypothetical protein
MSDLEPLARGRKLAAAILSQLERFYLAPGNREEGKRLDLLQGEFVEWERQTQVQFPDINTLAEFPDERLRPARKKIATQREYLRLRNQWSVDELMALPDRIREAKKTTHADGGMWSGTLGI